MCILFFTTDAHPSPDGYKLILAANRDEFYARPALTAAPWDEFSYVFGGRDMEPGREGGTWLAIGAKDKVFKFGALLNITGENRNANALGRGHLVSGYVSGKQTNEDYSAHLAEVASKYNGFNLVTIEIGCVLLIPSTDQNTILRPIYIVYRENLARTMHFCNTPNVAQKWPSGKVLAFGNSPPPKTLQKVIAGRTQFERIVNENPTKEKLVGDLMQLLQNGEKHWPDSELEFRAPNWAPKLSSICVKMPEEGYGSRYVEQYSFRHSFLI